MKRKIVIAAVAAVALIGGGTATAVAVAGDDGRAEHSGEAKAEGKAEAKEKAAELKSVKVTASDAIAAALRSAPGTAVSADLDDAHGKSGGVVWEVEVLNGTTWHDVTVDPGTGKVTGSHTERHDDTARVSAALKGTGTTAQDAARSAAAKGTVTEIDLADDGTAHAWEAETTAANGTESNWRVDARSGAVTAERASHDDDHSGHADRSDDDHARGHDDDHGRGHDSGDGHGDDD